MKPGAGPIVNAEEQKFFGSFFQKRTLFTCPTPPAPP
jgi:hypothetical protein